MEPYLLSSNNEGLEAKVIKGIIIPTPTVSITELKIVIPKKTSKEILSFLLVKNLSFEKSLFFFIYRSFNLFYFFDYILKSLLDIICIY